MPHISIHPFHARFLLERVLSNSHVSLKQAVDANYRDSEKRVATVTLALFYSPDMLLYHAFSVTR